MKKARSSKSFEWGNYGRYYAERRPAGADVRLQGLEASWFSGKDCVDVGCNEGLVGLSLAAAYRPRSMLGVDVDGKLIKRARQHLFRMRHGKDDSLETDLVRRFTGSRDRIPLPLEGVSFRRENITETPLEALSVDVIICFSVTKWIHLHEGDDGLKALFASFHAALRPGGKFIMEPQPWSSYTKRRKHLPWNLQNNYLKIQFKPEDFESYLVETLGFELISQRTPECEFEGFRRPIFVFQKKPMNS